MSNATPLRESETLALKKTLAEFQEGLVSLCAMLNKHGYGEIWFGIAPDGTAAGLSLSEKTARDVAQAMATQIEPKNFPSITEVCHDGKTCLKIVCEGADAPYYARGRAYMRVADADRQLSAAELRNMILAKHHDALRRDKHPSRCTLLDIEENLVRQFVERAKLKWDNLENILAKLNCTENNIPLNTALLFFGKNPMAKLRCAVFATTTSSMILD